MLKIKNKEVELIVSKGAFDNLYSHMGFEIVNENKPVKIKEDKVNTKIEDKPIIDNSKKESKKESK